MGIIAEKWQTDQHVQLAVQRATGLTRLTGLLLRGVPGPASGLLFERCRSVHGIGMRRSLDVVFLGADPVGGGRRVVCVRELRPGRIVGCRGADAALELRAGEATRIGLAAGDLLRVIERRGRTR